jgi:LmbE family N-acetylglucosaminyl deacetylase
MSEAAAPPNRTSALPAPGRSVLVVAPHPDDEVFGCGGTAALYARAGARVQALVLTDGGLYGKPPPGMGIVEARQEEARRAATVLGCAAPEFGPYADGGLAAAAGLADFITSYARRYAVDVLLAPSPWEVHPDHRAAALASIEAVGRLGEGHWLVQYEVGAPLLPNAWVDVTSVWPRKRDAMACFPSQLAMQHYERQVQGLNVFRTYSLPGRVAYAEAFRVATPAQAAQDPFGLKVRGQVHPVAKAVPKP